MQQTKRHGGAGGRVASIDGLRGALIAYIVLHHAVDMAPTAPWSTVFVFGGAAVSVFFFLSGFFLMGAFLRRGSTFEHGAWGFVRRRLRRLLPPYYAGLALSFGVTLLLPFHVEHGAVLPHAVPGWGAIAAHALAVQNFFPQFVKSINGNYWFFAVEIQLSLLFPVLALAWRRWGGHAVLFGCAALTVAWIAAYGPGSYYSKIQFLLLFAMGMAAAESWVRSEGTASFWLLVWGGSAALLAGILATGHGLSPRTVPSLGLAADVGVGFLAIGTVMLCVSPRKTFVRSLLEMPWLVRLGGISYAVYLVHSPVLRFLQVRFLLPFDPDPRTQFLLLATVGFALVVLMAAAFHRAFDPVGTRPGTP